MKLSEQPGWGQKKVEQDNVKLHKLLSALVDEVENLKERVEQLEKKNE